MRQLSKNYCSEGGFALVNIIVAIIIFSILGAALVKILSSSAFSQVGSNSSMRAYYLAEGGYRYAGSKFLHAGATESARDDMLLTFNNTTYTMANNAGSFSLQSYPWFYKSVKIGSTTSSLITKINGAISPNLTIPTSGKISVSGNFYNYSSIASSGTNPVTVTFTGIFPLFADDNITVLPVGVSTATTQTFANGGNLTLAPVPGASAFPPYHGTFKLAGNNTAYAYQNRSGNTLTNITDFNNPATPFSVSVPASTNVTLLKYLELHSTGTVGSGIMATNRMVNYRGPISSTAMDQGGGESNVIPPDTFDNPNNNWVAAPGEATVGSSNQVPGGGSALEITKTQGGGEYAVVASNVISDALKAIWSWSNGLSYDAQVKVATNINNAGYSGGISFRRHLNQGFGFSFVYLNNYNDQDIDVYADKIPGESSASGNQGSTNSCYKKRNANPNTPYCILAINTPYLVLWKYTSDDPSSFKTIAYYQLPSTVDPSSDPYWTTLMVRIKEKPSGSSYCSSFSSTRVNEIQVYYTTTANTGGDATATNVARLGNLRDTVNWPPDTGGTTAQNDFFTLVGWTTHGIVPPIGFLSEGTGPGWTGSYQFGNPGDGANTVVCTMENLTSGSEYGTISGPATPFPPEVALTAMGQTLNQHVFFDDFAIGSGPGGGNTTIGFLPPIQQ